MDVQADEFDPELAALELKLKELRPGKLPLGLAGRLETAIAEAVEAAVVEEKVIAFVAAPAAAAPVGGARRSRSSFWGAAAAVALLGAAAAWIGPGPAASVAKLDARKPSGTASASPAGGRFVPAGYGRNIQEASDEGVVWSQGQVPHRRVRVVYVDKAVMINAMGERIEVERPRVEWILVPEKMD